MYAGDKMYRVAIVEDEAGYREQVRDYIEKYGEEHHLTFEIVLYEDGREIVEDEEHTFDIIFFDIEMGEMNGMEAAERSVSGMRTWSLCLLPTWPSTLSRDIPWEPWILS